MIKPRGSGTGNGKLPSGASSRLGAILAGKTHEVLVPLEIPRIGPAQIRLLRRHEQEEVDVAVAVWAAELATEHGISVELLSASGLLPLASRTTLETMSRAVRDPENPDNAFGPLDEWNRLDDQQLGACEQAYVDLRAQLDPFAVEIPAAELTLITEAAKKKDVNRLFNCGAAKLVAYAIAMADLAASSPTPK